MPIKWLALLIWLILCGRICAAYEETCSLTAFLYGSAPTAAYDNWVSHLAEGIANPNYNVYAPYDVQTTGFGDYRVPTESELNAWGDAVDLYLAGALDEAQALLDLYGMPFQTLVFHDTDTGRDLLMLREVPDTTYTDDNGTTDTYDDETGAFTYGWGLYIYDPAALRPIIITVVHPCDDFPTPALASEAFGLWNARFLCIAGAGREVRWTNSGIYDNSKSLSDPSRAATHPFNTAYQKFADQIRASSGNREWSCQLHSYDWDRHDGYANVQISAGNARTCPNVPIRDLSTLKHDLINAGEHLMIPANTVGTHSDVYLNTFYSVLYSTHPFTFEDETHSYAVNNAIDLPAYSQNRQMLYTLSGWNDYDSYDPFFHAEMDELPRSYVENTDNYHWFYGWDLVNQQWDMQNLFTYFSEYYSRWLEDMDSVLDATFAMDDLVPPSDPTGLVVSAQTDNSVTLSWNRSYAYDFHTYEVLCSQQPISMGNYQIYDRTGYPFLASQGCGSITIGGLSQSTQYYFAIRALDKNGNYSLLSNEVAVLPDPPMITWNPGGFYVTVPQGQILQEYLLIGNTGDETLEYTASRPTGNQTLLEEGFETGSGLPQGWTQEYVDGSQDWEVAVGGNSGTPPAAHTGTYNARFAYNHHNTRVTKLVTPAMNLEGYASAILSFWHAQAALDGGQDQMSVYYRTFGDWILLASYSAEIPTWTLEEIQTPVMANGLQFAFEGISGEGCGVCLDDIRLVVSTEANSDWLSLNGADACSGSITPGSVDQAIEIGFDASQLAMGTYSTEITLISNSEINPTVMIPVELTVGEMQQQIALSAGWNLISAYVMPQDPDLLAVLSSLISQDLLVKVQDEMGNAIVKDINGNWSNNIGAMQEDEGYYISVSSGCVLEISGPEVALPLDVTLQNGWNILPYPLQAQEPALALLQPLIDTGVLVKVQDEQGRSILKDIQGNWVDGIGTFAPGEAYYINLSADCTFTYGGTGKRPSRASRDQSKF
jgi:hypothetical protein